MLLQQLCAYADRELALPPTMYQEQPIRYVIDLDRTGRPLGPPIDTADPQDAASRRGVRRLAPHVKRTVGIKPKLLADTAVYALGLPTEDARPERVRDQYQAFVSLTDGCARATAEPAVEAVAQFLGNLDPDLLALPSDFDRGATLTFRVDGVFPIDLPSVRAFWASQQRPDDEENGNAEGNARQPCIVCGHHRPVLKRHPLKIKGIPGGQTSGTDLISANSLAFESYGLANSLIAPTCGECAEKYGNALNALLRQRETHLRIGEAVYAFWTVGKVAFQPGLLLTVEDEAEVRELLNAYRTGRAAATTLNTAAFYALGLSASGSRVAVRSWIDTTVGEAQRRVARYFALQEMVDAYGAPWTPLPVWSLVNSTVRRGGKEAPRPEVVTSLIDLALAGTRLPLELLFHAVRRCRAEQGVSRERATLIKMVLGSREGGATTMTDLDLASTDPAYLCGRLLAVLEAIQLRALNNPNATIIDRYYGAASSSPASVFGTLLHGAQPHLAKLRKDPRTQPAQRALERRLEEIMAPLSGFPPTLNLRDQGLFALGYYHQRAADRRGAREHRAANEPVPEPLDDEMDA